MDTWPSSKGPVCTSPPLDRVDLAGSGQKCTTVNYLKHWSDRLNKAAVVSRLAAHSKAAASINEDIVLCDSQLTRLCWYPLVKTAAPPLGILTVGNGPRTRRQASILIYSLFVIGGGIFQELSRLPCV